MALINQKIEKFKSKSYEERLNIIMNIITNLKDCGNKQAQDIYDKILQMEEVPEDIIYAIYKDFCDSVNRIQQEKVQGQLHKFNRVNVYMQKLEDEEKAQREAENVESLLDWLDDL